MGDAEGSSKREGIFIYVWLVHFVAQQKHNSVKQLYPSKKF